MNRVLIIPMTKTGVGFWRFYAATFSLHQIGIISPEIEILSHTPTASTDFADVSMVMLQGFSTAEHLEYFKFLEKCRAQYRFHLVINADDLFFGPEVPVYNKGFDHYNEQEVMDSLKYMVEHCDHILTTTDYLASKFSSIYGIDESKIIKIPNLIPSWWTGCFDINKRTEYFKSHRANGKLKALITSSSCHFAQGLQLADDMSVISDAIHRTADFIEWNIIAANVPWQLKDIETKIKLVKPVPILDFINCIKQVNPDVIVAPLAENEFNKCKSNIKYLESAALGIPLMASRTLAYEKYMDRKQLFSSDDELVELLKDYSSMSAKRYEAIVQKQLEWLLRPTTECGKEINSWFLESNLRIWLDFFDMSKNELKDSDIIAPTNLKTVKD